MEEKMVKLTDSITITRERYDALMADQFTLNIIRRRLLAEMKKDKGVKSWTSVNIRPSDIPGFVDTIEEEADDEGI